MREPFKNGEVSFRINADSSVSRNHPWDGIVNAIAHSSDRIDALRYSIKDLGEAGYFRSSAYEKACQTQWEKDTRERTVMQEKKHSNYKIIKPTRYCKIEVSAEEADFVKKMEAVYFRGGKESLKSKLCFEMETFLGKEAVALYRNNELLAPFRSAGQVQILRENIKAVWNVLFYAEQYFDKSGFFVMHAGYNDRIWALKKKIEKSIEEYEANANR